MMMKAVHSYQAPLYGRATRRIHLQPFTYPALAQFFPAYQADELVATYAILGGVPAYLELFQAQMNFSENLRRVVLQPFSPMQSDSLLLLHEQFDQPALYAAILQAISMNKRSLTEIATYIDQPSTHVSRYLKILSDLGLIERQVPVTEMHKPNSRKGRYAIRDEYLRFYFRFIEPDLALLEFGQADLLLERIRPHLRAYVGEHAFEKLCRYWVLGQSARQKIPLQLRYLGSYWGSDAQLDVMATDSEHKRVLIGECKWGMEKVGPEVIEKLTRQAPKAINHLAEPAKWQPYLYLFTRTPLTEEAAVLAKTHKVEVVTLEQLDADLRTEE
jgi:AAA+ ATPase superfamily predicted ATPase